MKKIIIGIYADTFNGKVGQTFSYMHYFSQFGYVRLISTCDNLENIENEIDVLVLPGGADVNSLLYNGIPGVMDSRVNQHYEYLDSILIDRFINCKKPIIGICRGMQRLNVHFGGTLNQHINGHHQGENRIKTEQKIYLSSNNNNIFDRITLVNSLHHQCVSKLGENLEILAFSDLFEGSHFTENDIHIFNKLEKKKNNDEVIIPHYGVPEIIKHTELPIIGFQYHPEEFNCNTATALIKKIIYNE